VRKIKTFDTFNFDELDFINESKLYFLPSFMQKLRAVLSNCDEDVVDLILKLCNSRGKESGLDTTFIGLADDSDMLSFSTERELKNMDINLDELEPDCSDSLPNSVLNQIESEQKNKVKIGKLIKKIVPTVSDKTLEKMVNMLKSFNDKFEFKVVSGDEIVEYYTKDNCVSGGTLGNSCMADKADKIKNIFDIYTKNPQSVNLVVMLDITGKCVARAILWKIDGILNGDDSYTKLDNFYFMDRVYYTNDWMEQSMFKWAKSKNIPYKYGTRMFSDGKYENLRNFIIKLRPIAYRKFPYIDTFKYYNVRKATLSPNQNEVGDFDASCVTGEYRGGSKVAKATNFIRRFKDYI